MDSALARVIHPSSVLAMANASELSIVCNTQKRPPAVAEGGSSAPARPMNATTCPDSN